MDDKICRTAQRVGNHSSAQSRILHFHMLDISAREILSQKSFLAFADGLRVDILLQSLEC